MADSKQGGEIHVESFHWGVSNPVSSAAGELKAPPLGEDPQGAGPHVKVFDGSRGGVEPQRDQLQADPDDGGEVAERDHDKWINVESVNMGGHKAGGGSSASPGGEHELEYDIVAGNVADPEGDPEAIGSANGGVWKTTNFEPDGETSSIGGKMTTKDFTLEAGDGGTAAERSAPSISEIVVTKSTDSAAPIEGFLKVDDIVGESAVGGGKMHLEDISAAPTEPDPAVEIFLKLPDVNGEADDTSGGAHGAGSGGGAGKVSVHDISIMGEDDGPSSFAALTPTDEPEYLEVKLQAVKVTSYSVNGSGLDDSDDGPSSMARLAPDDDAAERSGEQTYLAIKLENVQITSYSLNSDEAPDDLAGGTEHEDSWEEVL